MAACPFVDQAQAVERERLVYVVDEVGGGRDERGQAARGDDARAAAQLLDHAPEDAVDESRVAVVEAGLNRGHGRGPDDLVRALDADAREPRRARKERVGRDRDARRDDAAEVAPALIDDLEVRRRAEVHDDAGRAVLVHRRHGVNDAVGPHVRGRVVEDGQPRVGLVADEERREVEVDLGHALQGVVELRHDRGDGYRRDGLEVESGEGEEVARVDAVLVDGARALRRQTPVPGEALALEHAERRVRIPHVHHKKHKSTED